MRAPQSGGRQRTATAECLPPNDGDVVEMYLDKAIEMRGRPALTAPRSEQLFEVPEKD
jgi:hypothetical protein